MKKIIYFFIIILLTLGGCSGNIEICSTEHNTSNAMSASYYQFSGTKQTKLTVEGGKTVEITSDIVTKKGTLDVLIYEKGEKAKENYNYQGSDLQTSNFTVTLNKPGDYIIEVKAKKHKGSYSFRW